ncbi:hypothetical protein ACFW04_014302 [Cataglyphis niger]
MASILKIGVWNANGLTQRTKELKYFLYEQNIDVMLISETHFIKGNYLNIPYYNTYNIQHSDGSAHGGSAIIVKSTIKHHSNENFSQKHLQTTSITIEDWTGPIILAAIYSPSRHSITQEQHTNFFKTLGTRFVAGGDYNAKHPWGILEYYFKAESCFDLSSDHSPILVTLSTTVVKRNPQLYIAKKLTGIYLEKLSKSI